MEDGDPGDTRYSDEWTANPLQLAQYQANGVDFTMGASMDSEVQMNKRGLGEASRAHGSPQAHGSGARTSMVDSGLGPGPRAQLDRQNTVVGTSFAERTKLQEKEKHRRKIRSFVFSAKFTCFMVVVTICDVAVSVTDMITSRSEDGEDEHPNSTIAFVHQVSLYVIITCLCLYVLELLLKMQGCGMRVFLRSKWNWFDVLIVVLSGVFVEDDGGAFMVFRLGKGAGQSTKLIQTISRIVRICRIFGRVRSIQERGSVTARRAVSKNKQRYVDLENNFDLDLTYITDGVVAMGVPATGVQGFFRNPLLDVARFFNERHPNKYRIYNCCPEMPYPLKPFRYQVVHFQIKDHTPPTMEDFIAFLRDARDFVDENAMNVIAVHCKAGKGRTGSLICAWLLYAKICSTPKEALDMFALQRTDPNLRGSLRGVETPSQKRYINQLFVHLVRCNTFLDSETLPYLPAKPNITLRTLHLDRNLLKVSTLKVARIRVLVECFEATSGHFEKIIETPGFDPTRRDVPLNIVVSGDVRVSIFEELDINTDCFENINTVPNAMQAKGLILMTLFHTDFMDLPYDIEEDKAKESQGEGSGELDAHANGGGAADVEKGDAERISFHPSTVRQDHSHDEERHLFVIKVQSLDKAFKKVKKGKHGDQSSISISYEHGGRMLVQNQRTSGVKLRELEERVDSLTGLIECQQVELEAQAEEIRILRGGDPSSPPPRRSTGGTGRSKQRRSSSSSSPSPSPSPRSKDRERKSPRKKSAEREGQSPTPTSPRRRSISQAL